MSISDHYLHPLQLFPEGWSLLPCLGVCSGDDGLTADSSWAASSEPHRHPSHLSSSPALGLREALSPCEWKHGPRAAPVISPGSLLETQSQAECKPAFPPDPRGLPYTWEPCSHGLHLPKSTTASSALPSRTWFKGWHQRLRVQASHQEAREGTWPCSFVTRLARSSPSLSWTFKPFSKRVSSLVASWRPAAVLVRDPGDTWLLLFGQNKDQQGQCHCRYWLKRPGSFLWLEWQAQFCLGKNTMALYSLDVAGFQCQTPAR